MYLTDKITKDFLTGSGQWASSGRANPGRWGDFEDPTYMGFYFSINPFGYYDPDNLDMDVLPQGLFMPFDEGGPSGNSTQAGLGKGYQNISDGAESFLRRRGEYYRSGMIREFREGFLSVAEKEPWIFEKVTGVDALWKVDPANPHRGKDKKIIFECHETISMKMSYLIDCYRKAAFDFVNMRYMLPDNQRFFSMDLLITEIRFMKRPLATGSQGNIVPTLDFNTGSFIRFRLDYCEFDFLNNDTLGYLVDTARYAGDKPASVKIPINIGSIREVNNYGMMGGLIADTLYAYQRDKETLKSSFTQSSSVPDANGEYVERFTKDLSTIKGGKGGGFLDRRSYQSSAADSPDGDIGATDWVEQRALFSNQPLDDDQFSFGIGNANVGTSNSPMGKQFLGSQTPPPNNLSGANADLSGATGSQTNLTGENALSGNSVLQASNQLVESDLGSVDIGSKARSLAGNLIRAAFLGNVYGFSLTTLAGQLQGILNNPVAALQGLLSKFAKTPEQASSMAENIQLSGADINLLQSFIGDIKEIQSVTAGTSLANATLGELTQLAAPTQTTPNPAKETLTTSGKVSLLQSDLGKILFSSSPVSAKAVVKENLTGADSTLNADMSPVTEPLQAPDVNIDPDLGNAELENNGTRLTSNNIGNVGYNGDDVNRRVSG